VSASARRLRRGFTLIELLVTLVVLSIILSFAIPGYRQYVQRASRVDATSALLRISAAQEKFYVQNGRYAGDDELDDAPPAGLGIGGTEQGYYALAITPAAEGLTVGYTASATARTDSSQSDDDDCWVFTINERGIRAAETRAGGTGTDVTERCWR
jgi:type IV pilus assembly protein PilE